ncbi:MULTISPECIES: phage virion morphogenesis protein [unclassified Sphingobium]|uniref:phage virion morphogenesis protein n=1 Tax=unclassified Sphingobium TaxID=2611147 RepID=UPI00222581A0|nr:MULTISPECIES: phage virion morphogenesis protein [unclassified Sphingobium]MCW2395189.1 phage virion morphogenesis protein [Sphingobium sp. B8D3B]MCW2418703.1 phage virion morphogenesis protein [Sphingobium sp. B8D3C]
MSDIGAHDLGELERLAGSILQSLRPAERRSLFRKVARTLRTSQQRRISAQRNPDGSRFERRKRPKDPVPGAYAVKFLYPEGGGGKPRVVLMHSWARQGPLMTGFDVRAGGIRSFEYRKVIRWLPVPDGEQNAGAGKMRRPSIRQRAMFRKIRRSGLMNASASAQEAWVSFAGRVAAVARIHQLGLFDKPSAQGPEVKYAMRQLFGFTAADRSEILDAVMEHVGAASDQV